MSLVLCITRAESCLLIIAETVLQQCRKCIDSDFERNTLCENDLRLPCAGLIHNNATHVKVRTRATKPWQKKHPKVAQAKPNTYISSERARRMGMEA